MEIFPHLNFKLARFSGVSSKRFEETPQTQRIPREAFLEKPFSKENRVPGATRANNGRFAGLGLWDGTRGRPRDCDPSTHRTVWCRIVNRRMAASENVTMTVQGVQLPLIGPLTQRNH